jgi:phosphoserine aminotransferase
MITFYPGPSKVYPQVERFMSEAFQSGLLSVNHRSEPFMQMLGKTITDLKHKLHIPQEYEIYFTSSATECWEMIAQSLVIRSGFHLYNGAFGAKWLEYAQKLRPESKGQAFHFDTIPDETTLPGIGTHDLICITHSETSNGTFIPGSFMQMIRKRSDQIIAVDATSSMAGVELPWSLADVWFASVQKCFGLPSGMGLMAVSPSAVERMKVCGDRAHYNSLLFVRENFLKNQTPYTPNVLGIYLLGRIMNEVNAIDVVAKDISDRAEAFYSFLITNDFLPLVTTREVRSKTVFAIKIEKASLPDLKSNAALAGITLGNGYGDWKDQSFRIANFPAISSHDFSVLKDFLTENRSVRK